MDEICVFTQETYDTKITMMIIHMENMKTLIASQIKEIASKLQIQIESELATHMEKIMKKMF